jgi:DNA polymerase-1
MQGTAADIIKRAMIEVDAEIEAERLQGRLIMQVHDELVLEVAADQAADAQTALVGIMQDAADLTVPLRVDARAGSNWDEAH